MKKFVRFLALGLCLCLLLPLLPSVVTHADAPLHTVGDLRYKITDGEVTVYGANPATAGELIIPDTIEGYPVTGIGYAGFFFYENLTSVVLPNSITTIAEDAFNNCTSLTDVTLPDSITSIGGGAFNNCTNLNNVTIPDSITSIGGGVFTNCSKQQYNIYDNGKYLGNERNPYLVLAEPVSRDITSVRIHPKTKLIGGGAFFGCSGLTGVTIPDSVIGIGYSAFGSCASLTSVTLPEGITRIDYNMFHSCTSLTDVTIPDSVTSIGKSAFMNCTSLTGVELSDSLTCIESSAFDNCTSLTNVEIPGSLTRLEKDAFTNCSKLEYNIYDNGRYLGSESNPNFVLVDTVRKNINSVNIHPETELLGDAAFSNCTGLTHVTIPDNVTDIGDFAFAYCAGLTDVVLPDGITSVNQSVFMYCTGLTAVTIPDSVTDIGYLAFCGCSSLTEVTIPDSVTTIGVMAFHSCASLTNVTIPDGVTDIGTGAFQSCKGLTGITLPDSITCIASEVFRDCAKLTNVGIPAGVTEIKELAFYGCYSLDNIYFAGNAPTFTNTVFDRDVVLWYHSGTTGWDEVAPEQLTGDRGNVTLKEAEHIRPVYSYDDNHTCTSNGTERSVCLTCGEIDIREVENSAAHRYVDGFCLYCHRADPGPSTAGLTLWLTAYGDGAIHLTLTPVGDILPTVKLATYDGICSFKVAPGDYILTAFKEGDVPRTYSLTLTEGETMLDVELFQPGELTGDGWLNVGDVAKIYAHSKRTIVLTDEYQLLCADYNGDGRINVGDAARLYALIKSN